jgi:AcrR family transcriptional regulator
MPAAVRRRARAEITGRIVEVARRHLATDGAAGLSLRAVARELGMVSSAVYRYVASRDELLTLLIVEGYDALGEAVEGAVAAVPGEDLGGRWLACCHAVRDWALARPHEYALLYGSPVPGYEAPQSTVEPATRVTAVLSRLLTDAAARDPDLAGRLAAQAPAAVDATAARAMAPVRPFVPDGVPDELVLRGLTAWTQLFGTVSFELFGHWHQVIDPDPALRRRFFDLSMRRVGAWTGLPA